MENYDAAFNSSSNLETHQSSSTQVSRQQSANVSDPVPAKTQKVVISDGSSEEDFIHASDFLDDEQKLIQQVADNIQEIGAKDNGKDVSHLLKANPLYHKKHSTTVKSQSKAPPKRTTRSSFKSK